MTSQQIHKLVLHPRHSDFALTSWDGLIARLREVEFLNEELGKQLDKSLNNPLDKSLNKEQQNRFLVGERFLQYITFTGCSPSIELTPPTDVSLDFCHIHFSEIYPETHFRSASQNVFARCPQCRKRISNWSQAVSLWSKDSSAVIFNCDKCAEQVSLFQLGWRHTAGFARMFIDIYSIYPQEGIPTDQFLSLLETQTGEPWDYFFTDQ
jgi:hypothetical protein